MSLTKIEVLRLYKNILLYSKTLVLTDPIYFRKRVAAEFYRNKNLDDKKKIAFAFQKGQALLTRRTVV